MKKAPKIHNLCGLLESIESTQTEIGGRWVPARPIGYFSVRYRIKAAWLVFTGKADALTWPGNQ